jgi:serine/threonine-protein kinase
VTDAAAASRGVSPSRLAKQLAGDLDTIVLKALAKAPAGRYATALALAEDLERHLRGLPVLAQRTSVWYRLGKFVGRNRWPVVIGAGAASALIAATGIALAQQRVAQAEARKATAVKDFLLDLLGAAGPRGKRSPGPTRSRRQSTPPPPGLDRR